MYDGSMYKYMDRKREYEFHIIVRLTNAGIMVHRREDLVASSLHMIIRTYTAEHWR